jgi:hypothetical protein
MGKNVVTETWYIYHWAHGPAEASRQKPTESYELECGYVGKVRVRGPDMYAGSRAGRANWYRAKALATWNKRTRELDGSEAA